MQTLMRHGLDVRTEANWPRSGGAFSCARNAERVGVGAAPKMSRRALVVTSNLDIYRTANILVEQHGTEAPIHAAMKADAMLEKGDLDGQRGRLRILAAVNELLDTRPGEALGRRPC